MHPKISKFISETFYEGKLVDGDNLMTLIGNPKIYNYYAFS
jgi:superfamily I DNA and/or RNA helicase